MADNEIELDAEMDFDELKKKKKKVLQKYHPGYEIKYSVLVSHGDNHAYCTQCRCNFSVDHGGIGDVEKHVRTAKHIVKVGSSAGRPNHCWDAFLTAKICTKFIFGPCWGSSRRFPRPSSWMGGDTPLHIPPLDAYSISFSAPSVSHCHCLDWDLCYHPESWQLYYIMVMWLWKMAPTSEVKKDEDGEAGDDERSVASLKQRLATLTSSLYTVTEQKSKMEAVYLSEKRNMKVWNTCWIVWKTQVLSLWFLIWYTVLFFDEKFADYYGLLPLSPE